MQLHMYFGQIRYSICVTQDVLLIDKDITFTS